MFKTKNVQRRIYYNERYVTTALMCLGIICLLGTRQCLPLCLPLMRATANKTFNVTDPNVCPAARNLTNKKSTILDYRVEWTEPEQNTIIMAFYFGFSIASMPLGVICDLYGAKHLFSLGVLFSGFLALITPEVIQRLGWQGTAVLRLAQGSSQALSFTARYNLVSHWIPRYQTVFVQSFLYASMNIGHILSNGTNMLIVYHYRRWRSLFYLWGIVSVCVYFICFTLLYSRPDEHPFISKQEKLFIEGDLGKTMPKKIPWQDIFSDSAVWSLLAGELSHGVTQYALSDNLVNYFISVMGFSPRMISNTFYIAYSCMLVSTLVNAYFADILVTSPKIPTLYLRCIYTAIGNLLPAVCLLAITVTGCQPGGTIFMFALAALIKGAYFSGAKAMIFDITRNYVGVVGAFENGFGILCGFATPYVVSFICRDNTVHQWRQTLWLFLGATTLTTTLCFIWAKGQRAEWDLIKK